MDDLIVSGTIGILALFIAGVLVVYGVASLVIAAAQAVSSGEYGFVLGAGVIIVLALLVYCGFGLWLRKTDRI